MKVHQKLFWLTVLFLPFQIGKHFWPKYAYVWGLKIDYLSPTIYLTDLLVFSTLFVWFVTSPNQFFKGLERARFFLSILFLFLLVNSFLAANQIVAFYKSGKVLELVFFSLYVAANRISLKKLFWPLSLSVLFTFIVGVGQFVKQSSLNGLFWLAGERSFNSQTPGIAKAIVNHSLIMRPYATFPHPNVLAGFLLVSAIFIIATKVENKTEKILKYFSSASCLLMILLSFSRTAWLASLAALFLFSFRQLRRRTEKILLVTLTIILGVLMISLSLPLSGNEAIDQRNMLFTSAGKMFLKRPIVGVGLNNFIPLLPRSFPQIGEVYWLQPVHNLFGLILVETRILGLGIFLYFLFLSFKRSVKLKRFWLFVTLVVISFTGLMDHYWFTLQQTQLLFALVLGLSWC